MKPNTNPETTIRYGVIAANSLHPDIVDEIQSSGIDLHWEEFKSELWAEIKGVCKDYMPDRESDEVADLAVENAGQSFQGDEPIHTYLLDGVQGRTTWLGGALLLYVFESPFITFRSLCSPCVPNCGDLDSEVHEDGYEWAEWISNRAAVVWLLQNGHDLPEELESLREEVEE